MRYRNVRNDELLDGNTSSGHLKRTIVICLNTSIGTKKREKEK